MSTSVIPLNTPLESWKPWPYQQKGVELGVSQACLGLLLDPGLGKTGIALMVFKILKEMGYVNRVLVISTKKGIYNSWGGDSGEIEKWREFSDLRWAILHGDDKDAATWYDADVFLINPDGLKWMFKPHFPTAKGKPVLNWEIFKRIGADMLIVDESTDFKNSQSKRFKMLRQVIPKFKRRMILTGTPSPNGLEDLFGQIYILDEGAALGQYITHYRSNFFYPDRTGYNWLPQNDALERISKKIAPLVLRMEAKDHLKNLPELIADTRWCEMPPEAWSRYKQMEDDLIVLLENDEIVAKNQAVASGKCRQIAAGGLYTTDVFGDRDYLKLHESKLDSLAELMDELMGSPILVFYEFNFEREMLRERFPNARFLDGSKNEPATIVAFNRGEIPLLCGQPASASKSINLQAACNHVGWLTQTWKADDHRQGIDRVRRQGNKNPYVISHYFMVRGTIDEIVFNRIVRKDKNSDDLSRALQQLRSQQNRG